jgi:hypothetical protein
LIHNFQGFEQSYGFIVNNGATSINPSSFRHDKSSYMIMQTPTDTSFIQI